ncbi:MAG: 6,7-dimethyl-8-ribityllumazine synthase [Bacteroidetes bacterium]|nr:6,7-dimethyl-8-ribityllumazine synthase [Bacteroidota bacterium]
MSSSISNTSQNAYYQSENNEGYTIGIVVSDYYSEITHKLLDASIQVLTQYGVKEKNIEVLNMPGAFELIYGLGRMIENHEYDGIIALGCVIKGDTDHDKYINQAVANSIAQLTLEYNIPITFGLLTTNTLQQAEDRSGGALGNKGKKRHWQF